MNADSSLLWFILLWLIISCVAAFSVWFVLGKALSEEALYAARTVIRLAALVGPLFVSLCSQCGTLSLSCGMRRLENQALFGYAWAQAL